MPPLTPERLAALLAPAARRGTLLLGTDFDGTLAPIRPDPEDATILPEAAAALCHLATRTPVAILSGRDATTLARLAPIPQAHLSGSYGLERWRNGQLEVAPEAVRRAGQLPAIVAALEATIAQGPPGVTLERKRWSAAVHFRPAADPLAAAAALRPALAGLATTTGWSLVGGRMVYELQPPGPRSKGTELRALLLETGARVAVYAGDDLGDIPAFAALTAAVERLELALPLAVLGAETPPELVPAAGGRTLPSPQAWARTLQLLAAAVP